ncbi:MAG: helix-turn-helix domain-containing protein [Chitinophagales bacterium]|nr:helix-turn-helix domain-containing protein [Chitinophagales bacterium]
MAPFSPDISNKMFGIAVQLVNQSSRNIFLTGKAGTGKTTFLKYIRENCPKQMAVVAPTGVAAINAGGVTIHSLFQLPISPFIPEAKGFSKNEETVNRHSLISRLRMNSDKKKVLQELELLIIDEISMVRCDTLDAVDTVLRHVRNRYQEPFGGVQVLFIGDMFQLPPVIKEQEWNLLAEYYNGPYFFDSLVIKQEQPVYIEFDKIYRQSEERFIRLLNQVRNNNLDEEGMKILESRFNPAFRRTKEDGFIILTTHNEIARQTNAEKLQGLTGKLYSFKADIDDDFPANAYPADELLQLKVGAQVMFIKNDLDKSKRYFNGKIGTVTKLEEEKIIVQCADEPNEIEVKKDKWENIRYDLNKTTRQLEEKLLGAFSQYPMRLAWAITIHKSQGLTFEKAIIDAGKSFAAGQVYVALSRCTSLEGMVLQSRINTDSLRTDQRIVNFSRTAASVSKLEEELIAAQKQYWQKILLSLFDFRNVVANCKELMSYITEHGSSFNPEVWSWLETINGQLISQQEVAERFQQQLQQLFTLNEEARLQERIKAAAEHFYKETASLIGKVQGSPAVTDSRLHAKEYNDLLKEIIIQLAAKKHILEEGGISGIEAYHTRKKSFIAPAISINAYADASHQQVTDIPNPILYQQLRKKRDAICERKGSPIYMVAGSQTLVEMCTYLPQTAKELEQITGFGAAKIKSYGPDFLDIIVAYCEEHGLDSRIDERAVKKVKKEKKEKKTNTKEETYHLFREGNPIAEIAKLRNLTPQTIEGHLAFYVAQGEIRIEELLPQEKITLMEPLIKDFTGTSITAIKEQFGDEVSFGEIRWMLAWQEYQKLREG